MILIDVLVLVYAYRAEAPEHAAYRAWLEETVNGEAAYGLADLVLSGFIRVVTHPRVFKRPTPVDQAIHVAGQLRGAAELPPGDAGPKALGHLHAAMRRRGRPREPRRRRLSGCAGDRVR